MNNKDTVNAKWERISKRSKKWHMFVGMPLIINIPLISCLIIMFELVDGDRHVNFGLFIATLLVKLILTYIVGVYSGHLEWEFLKKLVNKRFFETKEIRKNYVLIYGVCMFGANITIALLNPVFDGLPMTIFNLIIYPVAGIVWGFVMSGIGGSFSKYIVQK